METFPYSARDTSKHLNTALGGLVLAVTLVHERSVCAEARELCSVAETIAVTLVDESLVGAHFTSVREDNDALPTLLLQLDGSTARCSGSTDVYVCKVRYVILVR